MTIHSVPMTSRPVLDDFTQAYIQCALWAETDGADDSGGAPLDANYSVDDIDDEALKTMAIDCERFQASNGADFDGADMVRAGHDFWLTRNGHGSGFWDGDWPESAAVRLTSAAHAFGQSDIYVGDDGRLHMTRG